MTTTVLELGRSVGGYRVIDGIRHERDNDYVAEDDEIVFDFDRMDWRSVKKPPASCIDTSTDPPTIGDNPDYSPPDVLDRNALDPALLETYRDARDVYLAEKENFIDAKQADDVQGQLDALASLAENATVPALDALFRAAMGEEP